MYAYVTSYTEHIYIFATVYNGKHNADVSI